jgi:hypothetical protein
MIIVFVQFQLVMSLLVPTARNVQSSRSRKALSAARKAAYSNHDLRVYIKSHADRRCLSRLTLSSRNENEVDPSIGKSTAWKNSKSPILEELLQKSSSRAMRTLSTTASGNWNDGSDSRPHEATKDILDVVDAVITRSSSTMSQVADDSTQKTTAEEPKQHQDKRTYLNNPCVTPTALAHSLWKSTIIPYHDIVIDATCGNGKDCLALTKMLFPDEHDADLTYVHPRLIGIDIQSRAIGNTQRSLLATLSDEIYYNHVTLLERSHEHLLDVIVPRADGKRQEVGLVCYNLGYLPGGSATSDNYKDCKTQTQTTLNSVTEASLLLRVGGLLSIMTYPASNLEESIAVEHFVEGLAMLTTRDEGGWRGYLESIPEYSCNNDGTCEETTGSRIKELVSESIERVAQDGSPKQTWRAFVHKPLGRPLSPILVTAHRIK